MPSRRAANSVNNKHKKNAPQKSAFLESLKSNLNNDQLAFNCACLFQRLKNRH